VEELPVADSRKHLAGWICQSDAIALYNREVLRRDAVVRFIDDTDREAPREELVHLPSGDVKDEIPVGGNLVGKTLRELNLRAGLGVNVYAVRHKRSGTSFPDPAAPLNRGDTLVVVGPMDKVAAVRQMASNPQLDKPALKT
jgi:K+/H+ antiporter YhaU regulatory subunit KhtT